MLHNLRLSTSYEYKYLWQSAALTHPKIVLDLKNENTIQFSSSRDCSIFVNVNRFYTRVKCRRPETLGEPGGALQRMIWRSTHRDCLGMRASCNKSRQRHCFLWSLYQGNGGTTAINAQSLHC